MPVRYCTRCVFPSVAASPLTFDEHGVCSGCRVHEQTREIDWNERAEQLRELVSEYRSTSNYDIVIPVSGGKDSYYQTDYAIRVLGLKPLLVTYHGNNYLPEGEYNLQRMREVFDCDHVIVRPSMDVLVKMNRIGFKLQGDMNWHAHCGIFTTPIQVALRYKVPLMLWGEHGFLNLSGMYSLYDYVEFTAKHRKEHSLRGFDWYDFTDEGLERIGRPELKEGLTAKDLLWAQYPSDEEIDAVGVRGIYLGNYVNWDGNDNAKLAMERYGWQPARQPFERTYRLISNIDDMHENGIHDYLKFVKFGYGRASDHACKDIRAGIMSRDEGVRMVRRYDHVKPRRDLERWLRYVGMSEEEFDYVCDTFRDPRVWRAVNGEWVKDNIWGEPSAYGPTHLEKRDFAKLKPSARPEPGATSEEAGNPGERMNTAHTPLSEEEIRPDELMEGQAERFARDVARMAAQKHAFVEVGCPACGQKSWHKVYEKNHMDYVVCDECETMFVNPRPSPAILEDHYKTSENYAYWNNYIFPASEQARREKIFVPRAERLADICKRHHVPTRTLLEVGAGFGIFCEEIARLGLFQRVIGVEPTPDLAATCRGKGIETLEKPIEHVELPAGSVDVVASFEVIEHLFSPGEFVARCGQLLAPGGLLILTCPNVKGFDISVLGPLSKSVDIEHLNYFHPMSLARLVGQHGFEVIEVATPGKLDAELVRKKALSGEFDLSNRPFLKLLLLDMWESTGDSFQQFLAENGLSSHMWLIAKKK